MAIHPVTFNGRESTNRPITLGFAASSIVMTINGAEINPLSTAARNSARIGLMPMKLSDSPISVAPARTP